MKRALPLLVTTLLMACGLLSAPLPPAPPADSTAPTLDTTSTFTPVAPTATATLIPSPANATTFPDSTAYQWIPVVSGLDSPIDIEFLNDGTGRMFVIEQAGRIRVVENSQLLETPFLDITDRVHSTGNEQGLLGLAFDPHYKDNGFFYVNYTGQLGATFISRFQVTSDPNIADPNSEKNLLHINQPFPNHNGGETTFGPDGYLYLGLGDGGSAGDPFGNGQSLDTFLGKILRIDVSKGDPYSIPPDNPFVNGGGKPEIWEYGLRNPWRFSFDQATGDLYIGDVGQDAWEEIDYVPAGTPGGLDFGWNYREGNHKYIAAEPPASLHLTYPVVEYSHAEGGCSVTGGYVYRGAMPEWRGIYLYGDFCSGIIWGLIKTDSGWQHQVLFDSSANITAFGQDPQGEIYLASRGGTIYRLGK
ncbi:MAG TPA: PQQ-dependent sugar dehydrogenase [Anaerolineales bacterium]|nr:PQQ-dependent sugar dehydrogenase [Anaerolineales bacterium]